MTERPLWRSTEPKAAYDVVIVGGGGHGLSTAYHLARYHGITDVCVLEKGWLAGGNVARNTTIVRSNYLWDESAALYERSLQMWEGLEDELGFDVEFRQRGLLALAHSEGDERASARRIHANRLNGIDAEWLSVEEVAELCPIVNLSPEVRYPVVGGALQRRAGTARHDKVAWAFATRASELGVDIVEHCEVTGFELGQDGRIERVRTTRGEISARRVALVAAGHSSVLASMLGLRLPLQSHPLQALVSVLLEPVLEPVVLSSSVHVYVSQADKGELVMGAGMDPYTGYAQRGSFRVIEYQLAAAVELFPIFANAKLLRTWAGIVDVAPDASPILSRTPIENLFLNCGWGTGGFKATPVSGMVFAELIANGEPGPLAAPFGLDRFASGALIDEHGAAAVAH